MSSDSDRVVFDESVSPQDNTNLFQSKKWTYITDSTSSNGVFNGQLQFDLGTLSSQNQWTDLSQGVIQFPVKLSIKNAATNTGSSANILAACIKNGFHQFVDSVQITIGGTTIQSSQIFTNIDTQYKILSEWSSDELNKYGPSLGIALDDYAISKDTATGVLESLDNAATWSGVTGFDMTYARNPGFKDRAHMLNNNVASASLGQTILGSNAAILGKGRVQVGTSVVNGEESFVLFALGTIRLKDISDAVAKLPLMKGLKGFIYVNYNAGVSTISTTAGSATITGNNSQALYGRVQPGMFNEGVAGYAFSGTNGATVQFTAEISAVKSTLLSSANPPISTAVLRAPYFVASPEVDRALTMKKTIRYNERFVSSFDVAENANYTLTLSPGISNPKRVILFPYFTGAGSSGLNNPANPLLNPFDSCPGTTSPFAALKDLQLYVGNVPMWQSPVSSDSDVWFNEMAQQGVDGGLVSQTSSGLLSQRTWNQLYRFYTCDVGRRMDSEDGASKSIQLQATNATTCPMRVISNIWYEKEITVDTAMGTITQGM